MTKDEIIKKLRDMAKYPTVTLPRDCEALKAAADLLEQKEAKDEPVGVVATDTSKTHLYYGTQYLGQKTDTKMVMLFKDLPLGTPVYTTPPQRTWFGLTAQEAADCWTTNATKTWNNFEAKLKEKNTP